MEIKDRPAWKGKEDGVGQPLLFQDSEISGAADQKGLSWLHQRKNRAQG